MKHEKSDLIQMQSLPLELKIIMTKQRIKVWYENWSKFEIVNTKTHKMKFVTIDSRDNKEPELKDNEYIESVHDGQVYVSFSGGKDSTVLLHMVREMYPDVEAVFVNTGLEYPEIQKFVKAFDNVTILKPKMQFNEVIKTYGYPMISKAVGSCVVHAKHNPNTLRYRQLCGEYRTNGMLSKYNYGKYKPLLNVDFNVSDQCCSIMKKQPLKQYHKYTGKVPITAVLASESLIRNVTWMNTGCNAFNSKNPRSAPMSFWTEQDVLRYIYKYNLPIADVYGKVVYSGSCHFETTGCNRTGCIFCGFGAHLEKGEGRFERLKRTHPKQYDYCINGGAYDENGVWKPDKHGLGMKHVLEVLNQLYGEDFIKF